MGKKQERKTCLKGMRWRNELHTRADLEEVVWVYGDVASFSEKEKNLSNEKKKRDEGNVVSYQVSIIAQGFLSSLSSLSDRLDDPFFFLFYIFRKI